MGNLITLSGRRIQNAGGSEDKKKKKKESKSLTSSGKKADSKPKERGVRGWLMRKSPKYRKLMKALGD